MHEGHLAPLVVHFIGCRVAHKVALEVKPPPNPLAIDVVVGDVYCGHRDGEAGVRVAANVEWVGGELLVLGKPLAEEGVQAPP